MGQQGDPSYRHAVGVGVSWFGTSFNSGVSWNAHDWKSEVV